MQNDPFYQGSQMDPTSPEATAENAKRAFARIGLAVSVTLLVTLLSTYLLDMLSLQFFPQLSENPSFSLLIGTVPMYLFGFFSGYLILRALPCAKPQKGHLQIGTYFILLLMMFGVLMAGNMISTRLITMLELLTGRSYANTLETTISESSLWLTVLLSVIIAPIVEELFFRKLVIDRIRGYGDGIAILFSGILFGLFHGNLYQIFYTAGLGILFGWVYIRTGKLRYSISLHILFNLIGGVLIPQLFSSFPLDELLSDEWNTMLEIIQQFPLHTLLYVIYSFFLYGAFLATVILLIVKFKTIRASLSPGETPLVRGKRVEALFCNPGIPILLFLLLALLLLSFL